MYCFEQASKATYEFLDLTNNVVAERFVELVNDNAFSMRVGLGVVPTVFVDGSEEEVVSDEEIASEVESKTNEEVKLDSILHYVAARSTRSIRLRLQPKSRGTNRYRLYYWNGPDRSTRRAQLCNLVVVVNQPSFIVVDVQCSEQAVELGRNRCWESLRLSEMNRALTAPLPASCKERTDLLTYGRSLYPCVRQDAMLVSMDLGIAPIGRHFFVRLMLYNNESVVCRWSVRCMRELKLHVDSWSSGGRGDEPPGCEAEDRLVVTPRTGTIMPGEADCLSIRYCRTVAGEHTLLLLLRIDNGAGMWVSAMKENDFITIALLF